MRYKKLSDLQRDIETLALDSNNPVRLRRDFEDLVRADGSWELSPEHEVVFKERRQTIDYRPQLIAKAGLKNERTVEKEATIKGALVAAEPDALVIAVTTKEDPAKKVTGLVKLSGKWELDEKNRITFTLGTRSTIHGPSKDRGAGDAARGPSVLTFQGAWEINQNHEVVYSFETEQVPAGRGHTSLAGKAGKKRRRVTKTTHELVFKGEWDISEKHCLTYLIGGDSDSAFRFRGTFETQSILAKKGEIRYQAGIEYKTARGAKKRLTQTITLFGKWKLSNDLALSFEVEYEDGRRSEMRFGADVKLPKTGQTLDAVIPDTVSADLVSRTGKPLGLEVVLTKDFFDGNAQLFMRFARSQDETRVEAGVRIPW